MGLQKGKVMEMTEIVKIYLHNNSDFGEYVVALCDDGQL